MNSDDTVQIEVDGGATLDLGANTATKQDGDPQKIWAAGWNGDETQLGYHASYTTAGERHHAIVHIIDTLAEHAVEWGVPVEWMIWLNELHELSHWAGPDAAEDGHAFEWNKRLAKEIIWLEWSRYDRSVDKDTERNAASEV